MRLQLTYDETQKLDETGSVYALRENATWLVEKQGSKYLVQMFSYQVDVIKTYQKELPRCLR